MQREQAIASDAFQTVPHQIEAGAALSTAKLKNTMLSRWRGPFINRRAALC